MRTFHLLGKPLNTEQPVGFTDNYEEEITLELTEAKTSAPAKQSGPASSVNAFFFRADFAHSTIT